MTSFVDSVQSTAAPFLLPDFSAVTPAAVREALQAALAEQRDAWEAIATSPDPATIENTLLPLARSGAELEYVLCVGSTFASSIGGEEWDALESEIAPLLSEHSDALWLDERIYGRLDRLRSPDDAETAWLLKEYLRDFRRRGVALPPEKRAELSTLNTKISTAETRFEQRATHAIEEAALHITDRDELAGLDDDTIASLAESARARDLDGWLVTLISPTQQPLLARLTEPSMRTRLLAASMARGDNPETRALILDLARLRATRAELLGYPHHAALVADAGTAPSSDAIIERLRLLAPPAARNVTAEAAALAKLKAAETDEPFAASDWFYYEEKLRAEKVGVDEDALRPYLELNRVLNDGVFWAAAQLYGISFTERPDLTGWAAEVRVWEVRDTDGAPLALFVGDYFARKGKRGGAWMHNIVEQSRDEGTLPVVVNNLNVTLPPPGEPTLLTWDEVITCFHEFGHALHGMLSGTNFRRLAGTNVPRDFVEYPSQVNEMWLENREVLAHFARHHLTGEVLPDELLEPLLNVRSFGQGFATGEYLAAALLDQAWHRLSSSEVPTDPRAVLDFEENVLAEHGLTTVPPRYRSTYFAHAFGGGYDANYYSYIWSEVLDADTQRWFSENGDLDAAAGATFRREVLSRGNSRDPLDSFRALTGREPELAPLLERRGLV